VEKAIEPETIDLNKGLTEAELDKLIGARNHLDFLNPKNDLYRERGMKEKPPGRAEAIRLMSANPNLIRRPLLVSGKTVLFGFKPEEWENLKH
jgi:arsenate reductase-like glutaredoxin family protein